MISVSKLFWIINYMCVLCAAKLNGQRQMFTDMLINFELYLDWNTDWQTHPSSIDQQQTILKVIIVQIYKHN